ncbi:MAG: AAA family ATPase [Oscillospiraceae bacterium]
MSQIFAVTSGKGGVGKSTVSAGLAFAFSGLSKKTLLVDMDEGLRCLDIMLGVDSSAVFDLSDILMGKDMADAVYKVGESNNLFLVPAPSEVGKIDAFAFSGFVREAEKEYDIIIFDFPAGMDFRFTPVCLRERFPDGGSARSCLGTGRSSGKREASRAFLLIKACYQQF